MYGFSYGYVKFYPDKSIHLLNPYIVVILILYVVVCAIRYNVGVDFETYLSEYLSARKFSNSSGLTTTEIGWNQFTWSLSRNNIHYTIYFGIIALLQFIFVLKAFSNNKKLLPYLIISFFIGGYFIDFQNVLRQNIVNAVFLYVVMKHRNIKFIKYLIIVALCFLIHKSSLVLILLYPLIKINSGVVSKTKLSISLLIICCLIGLVGDLFAKISQSPLFIAILSQSDYSVYSNEEYLTFGISKPIGIGFFLRFLVDCVLVVYSKKVYDFIGKKQSYAIYYQLFLIGTCAHYLFPTSMIIGRPLLYLLIFNIPILTYYLYYALNQKYSKWNITKFINLTTISVLVLLFSINHIVKPDGYKAQWDFYWNHTF